MLARLRDREYKRALHARLSGVAPGKQLPSGGRTQRVFCRALFLAMGKLAKLDGRVCEEEVAFATETMHTLGLTPVQRHHAIDCFYAGKLPQLDLGPSLEDLLRHIGPGSSLARQFLKTQCRLAFSKGVIRLREKLLLREIAESLGFDKAELLRLYTEIQVLDAPTDRRGRPSALAEAYEILGLDPAAGEADIRRAYRRLIARYHPDKLHARAIDAEGQALAREHFLAVRAAYERIRRLRKRSPI